MDRHTNHGISTGGNLTNTGAMAVGPGASAAVHRAADHDPPVQPVQPVQPAPSVRIFVSYRSQDDPGTATLLKRELSHHFGADNVFIDSGMIPPGSDYERALLRQVRRCDVLLAVIGPRWLTATHPTGGPAINHPEDWVRRELAEAFANDVPVVPVLVNDAARLTGVPLPGDIARLATCQYLTLRHNTAESDLTRIVDQLARTFRPDRSAPPG